ncbi:MAG: DEAD/DEAH box helicase [Dehalococcoidia bacterium]|nr:DEAD/DEAH box helicase [Dehalococcoidia bacterium]
MAWAVTEISTEYRDLPSLAQGLLPDPSVRLWKHQWTSLKTMLQEGKDLVVTTGTGSGKTECILLPVLAELARESEGWPASPPPLANRKWWKDDSSEWQSQWAHTGRSSQGSHAIRAIVLYPLNALVEDQLRRLRQTLDSEEVLSWLDDSRGGNRITFGRYTGATPVSGRPGSESAVQRLRHRLGSLAVESAAVRGDVDLSLDVKYYFPNIDGAEMWSRWDMQHTPPDILITNCHMLNIMLMRQIEAGMFEKTRAWLQRDPGNKFFLIVDELHSYRGTAGTEVGYILRLLLDRLGLSPESDQLVILATSASLPDSPKSREFLSEFFGRDRFEIVSEDQEPPEKDSHSTMRQYGDAFKRFAHQVQPDVLSPMLPPDPESTTSIRAMSELVEALGCQTGPGDEAKHTLAQALLEIGADDSIRDVCLVSGGSREVRATRLTELDHTLFGPNNTGHTATDAMRGLLLALGMSRNEAHGTSPQPIRGHLFFHNVQNMWVCASPDCDGSLHRKVIDSLEGGPGGKGPVGTLHVQNRITCSCGGRVLDLLVCEVCGDILLGGYRGKADVAGQPVEILAADRPNIADMPNWVSGGQKHGQYAVFWPLGIDEPNGEPEDLQFSH